MALTLRSDTRVVERGGSRLYLPATSAVAVGEDVYTLQSGVLWVKGSADSEAAAFHIRVGDYTLRGLGADFAVEKVTGAVSRLYVSRGEVLATRDGRAEPLHVVAGQTLALEGERAAPVDLAPGAGALLRAAAGSVARFEAAPLPSAQRAATVSGVVVVIAQVLMLLAYAITFVGLPVMVVAAIVVCCRRRSRNDVAGH